MDLDQNNPMVIMVEVANFAMKKLMGFTGERVDTQGYVDLLITFGYEKSMRTIFVQYLVIAVKTSKYLDRKVGAKHPRNYCLHATFDYEVPFFRPTSRDCPG
ncbi:hypothetical protein CR513_08164, partial [Mucuna pruriens]